MDAAALNAQAASGFAADALADGKMKALRGAGAAKALDPKAVKKTAEEFETVFLEQMFNHMFSTVGVDGVTGGGMGEESARSMLVNAYAKNVVKAGGIGLAPAIASEIVKIQEKANGTHR
jgi:Rod binding domain-containing protein